MTLSRVRNAALVLAVVSFVVGIVMSFSESGAAPEIEIGHHITRTIAGMTFNIDTIISTFVAGAVVILMGFAVRGTLTETPDHVPTKLQLLWETVVGQVNTQVEDNLGKVHPFVAPLAVCLFFFILFANWLELLPIAAQRGVPPPVVPTADTNLTYALALFTIVSVWVYGIRQKGLEGYLKHFAEPFPVLLPLNVLEELIKPVTLALRLFGNIFAGGIMLSLITLIPIYAMWAPNMIWKVVRRHHRGHPGVHLRAAHRPLLRDGRRRTRRRGARGGARPRLRAQRVGDRSSELTGSVARPQRYNRGVRQGAEIRREIQWQNPVKPSRWPVRSSAAASPSQVAPSAPVSVTAWPVRPTSRVSPVSPRRRVASRRSSS